MQKVHSRFAASAVALGLIAGVASATPAAAQTVVDDWSKLQMAAAPQVKPVKIEPQTTALLVLDLLKQSCNNERRPRCVATIPQVAKLIADARAHNVAVVYSITTSTKAEDILPPVAPKAGEPMVASNADKFVGTDLEKILKDKGIKTVIVTGTTAEGAVLYTASGAAFRGMNVIVPLEGSTAGSEFAEAVTAWVLTNAPAVGAKTTLTKIDMIGY